MSFNRYARKADTSQQPIVDTLREAGVQVWVIGWPVDLLVRYWSNELRRYVWQPLECKSPYGKEGKQRVRKDQLDQAEFIRETGTPIVLTGEQALRALGVIA